MILLEQTQDWIAGKLCLNFQQDVRKKPLPRCRRWRRAGKERGLG
jgi:hypothetical protein